MTAAVKGRRAGSAVVANDARLVEPTPRPAGRSAAALDRDPEPLERREPRHKGLPATRRRWPTTISTSPATRQTAWRSRSLRWRLNHCAGALNHCAGARLLTVDGPVLRQREPGRLLFWLAIWLVLVQASRLSIPGAGSRPRAAARGRSPARIARTGPSAASATIARPGLTSGRLVARASEETCPVSIR